MSYQVALPVATDLAINYESVYGFAKDSSLLHFTLRFFVRNTDDTFLYLISSL